MNRRQFARLLQPASRTVRGCPDSPTSVETVKTSRVSNRRDLTVELIVDRQLLRLVCAVACVPGFACARNDASRGGAAGLATVFDSTADTISARVDGTVPLSALRSMDIVMRIAPAADDTSLFTDVSDFEIDLANRIWIYDYQNRRCSCSTPPAHSSGGLGDRDPVRVSSPRATESSRCRIPASPSSMPRTRAFRSSARTAISARASPCRRDSRRPTDS